jgi:hypothetical protein
MALRRHPLLWSLSLGLIVFGVPGFTRGLRVDLHSADCTQTVSAKTNPEIVSFDVKHDRGPAKDIAGFGQYEQPSGSGWDDGVLNVVGACVFFYKAGQHAPVSIASCPNNYLARTTDGSALLWGSLVLDRYLLIPNQKDLTVDGLLQGIAGACSTQEGEEAPEKQAQAAAIRKERAELQAARQMAQDDWQRAELQAARQSAAAAFREGMLAALHAAKDPDPFASIRGEFDLSARNSRQWKTSLHLAGAERCDLLKSPSSTPTSSSSWTFGCAFRASSVGYEGMVKSVQSVLNAPYQPDDRAVNINQVFFADPSKPARRVFVAKINEATVGISVVAVRSAGAPADFNAAQFPVVPTMLPTEPTVSDEVEKIRSSRHVPMPPAQRSTAGAAGVSGRTTMTVQNSTAYELSVFFKGPVSKKLTPAPGASQDVDLAPGTFQVAGRVAAPDVLPFYGEETYAGSASYSLKFYIGQ